MFGESLDLASVLNRLKRADEALTECIAPLWPGVKLVAAWVEHAPHLFHLRETPAEAGYFLLGTREDMAHVIREAEPDDAQRYRNYLERATVILLDHELAYPASFAERLQGITKPRPIHFAPILPSQQVVARFDGINLFFERIPGELPFSPLDELFSGNTIFTPGELLGIPGQENASDGATQAQQALDDDPNLLLQYQLSAVLDPAGGVLNDCSLADDALHLRWRRLEETGEITLTSSVSPITSGICLPGAHGFDSADLTRFLLAHALDAWR